jgi:5-oxoprolinase (ATP-hydrolysing)|tara:strand:+ start:4642 stop:8271 length:3630 start_codon:yes stop_codon:yes gene_type:complete
MSKWFFAIDRGGTFTDVIGIDPSNKLHKLKLLSESLLYEDSVIEGIRRLLKLNSNEKIPSNQIDRIRIGTTIATNALLERKGAKTALLITKGFRDLLEIGNQSRPRLFDLSIKKPEKLFKVVYEIDERLDSDGKIIRNLNEMKLLQDLKQLKEKDIESVAIVLMHSWKNPVHEERCYEIAKSQGFSNISVSSKVIPLIKIVGRGQTTVVDSYLYPILNKYILSIEKELGGIPIEFMQSSGGLTDSLSLNGKDAIMSGPAGGVIGAAKIGNLNKIDNIIGFDMGGTSTDISKYSGKFEKVIEVQAGGIEFQASSLDVKTIAAGGGSLLWFDGSKLQVGPESAGSNPGPVCYGLGGKLALTDANLILNRINSEYFPSVFGPNQDQKLDRESSKKEFKKLTKIINKATSSTFSIEELALGFIDIANEKMSNAIKEISVSRGYDVRKFGLICFGGASPQHSCGIAKILGIKKTIIHPLASLQSAYGIANAEQFRYGIRSFVRSLNNDSLTEASQICRRIKSDYILELESLGISSHKIRADYFLDLRIIGTDSHLTVSLQDIDSMTEAFSERYQKLFGFKPSGKIEIANVNVEIYGSNTRIPEIKNEEKPDEFPDFLTEHKIFFEDKYSKVPFLPRDLIPIDKKSIGPAMIFDDYSSILIEPGFSFICNKFGHLIIEQEDFVERPISEERDPISLEIFNNLFMSTAEQMGYTLRNMAHSVNIKERLDFSCALFDGEGNLVANAPHVPVHLGAMSESVKSIINSNRDNMKEGDFYLINNPHKGGSHLPDLTVIAPVFSDKDKPIFYAASRGHHADIGGITPGSIPPFSTKIEEEGIIIDNFLIVENGIFREKDFEELLTSSDYPARNLDERKNDVNAQIASVHNGIKGIEKVIKKYGISTVKSYMGYIRENSAEAMSNALENYLEGKKSKELEFEDYLDDGAKICVKLIIGKSSNSQYPYRAIVDFSGTSPQMKNNLNAPIAVTKAAVLYVFRLLINREIPLNSGCLDLIEIKIPKGSLLNPNDKAAVVGGNVETSQRVTDVLLGALGIAAASQGTMNNFVFGNLDNSGKQYYETIAGGSGATQDSHGASAVQVHMTNTRSTDPEILEQRFKEIRLEEFSIRNNSGGNGKYRGGNGVVRSLYFLEPRKISIVSERRTTPPYGVFGGESGKCGINSIRSDGKEIKLDSKVERVVEKGETIIIKTPGGGGFGINLVT